MFEEKLLPLPHLYLPGCQLATIVLEKILTLQDCGRSQSSVFPQDSVLTHHRACPTVMTLSVYFFPTLESKWRYSGLLGKHLPVNEDCQPSGHIREVVETLSQHGRAWYPCLGTYFLVSAWSIGFFPSSVLLWGLQFCLLRRTENIVATMHEKGHRRGKECN